MTNRPLRVLANSKNLSKAAADGNIGWGDHQEMLRKIFRGLLDHEEYTAYMASEERGFRHDRECLIRMFRKHMINEGCSRPSRTAPERDRPRRVHGHQDHQNDR